MRTSAFICVDAIARQKSWRRESGLPWFADEQPSEQAKQRVEQVLTACDWKVDVVLLHTCPVKYTPTEAYFSGIDQSKVGNSTEN